MVKSPQNGSEDRYPADRWVAAMREHGWPEERIRTVVETAAKPQLLLTLDEAAREFKVPVSTIRNWVQRGHLKTQGQRFHAPGGRRHLVDWDAVLYLILHPPKRTGRPPNSRRKGGLEGIAKAR